jgi:uncharacterized protein (TIGR00730 family)
MYKAKMAEAWRVMRIQSELVDGIEKLIKLGPAVTIFGSARFQESNPYYQSSRDLAARFAREGLAVITGGGPGIMEGANRGAFENGGRSIGLNIQLPAEQSANKFQTISLDFRYFFVRKFLFLKHAVGFVIYPGGFGTMDELFEVLTLIQTHKTENFPVVLVGKSYWQGLLDWMRHAMLEENGCISPEDLNLFSIVDTAEEAACLILECYRQHPETVGDEEMEEKALMMPGLF